MLFNSISPTLVTDPSSGSSLLLHLDVPIPTFSWETALETSGLSLWRGWVMRLLTSLMSMISCYLHCFHTWSFVCVPDRNRMFFWLASTLKTCSCNDDGKVAKFKMDSLLLLTPMLKGIMDIENMFDCYWTKWNQVTGRGWPVCAHVACPQLIIPCQRQVSGGCDVGKVMKLPNLMNFITWH